MQVMQRMTRIRECQDSQKCTGRKGCENAKMQRTQKFLEFKA